MLQPLIKPLVSSQEQTVKAIQNSGTQELARELRRRNDQVDTLAQQPFYFDSVPSITAPQISSPKSRIIDPPPATFVTVVQVVPIQKVSVH